MRSIDLSGKNALVLGVANQRSLAWAIAAALGDAGARLALTYQGERLQDKVQALSEKYPDCDPLTLNFVDLRQRVLALDGFDDAPDRCGEKILEAIQGAWIEELD